MSSSARSDRRSRSLQTNAREVLLPMLFALTLCRLRYSRRKSLIGRGVERELFRLENPHPARGSSSKSWTSTSESHPHQFATAALSAPFGERTEATNHPKGAE